MSANREPRTPHATSEINVTPFLDVLLVLLIMFMVLVRQTVLDATVQLPQPCAGACDGDGAIVLEVGAGASYRVNQRPVAERDLRRYLATVYAGRPEKVIHVRGIPGVRYHEVVAAMDAARGAGVRVIGLAGRDGATP